jgi:EpsI family protein
VKRRDLVFGALGLAALGTAEALRPRRRLKLLQDGTIKEALPVTFGPWSSEESSSFIGPELSGSVTQALYSELVPRTYFHEPTGEAVMMLAAYGDTQSDLLQLHRPEFCYPAVGFNLEMSRPEQVRVGEGLVLPSRKVVAVTQERTENIIYWTRMGEDLPQSAGQQRAARINQSMQGIIPDGILMRLSVAGESEPAFELLEQFIPALLRAIPLPKRKAFIGTKLSTAIG